MPCCPVRHQAPTIAIGGRQAESLPERAVHGSPMSVACCAAALRPLISTWRIVVDRTVPDACTIRCQDLSFMSLVGMSLVDRAPCVVQRWLAGSLLSMTRFSLTAEQRNSRSRAYATASCWVAKRIESHSHSPESSITTSTFQDMFASCVFLTRWTDPVCDACRGSLGGKVLVDAASRDSSVFS